MVKANGRKCQYKNNSSGVKGLMMRLNTRPFSNIFRGMVGIPLWEWIGNVSSMPNSYMNT